MKILRLPVVENKTGLKHSTIYEKIQRDQFPRQVPLGLKAVGWLEHYNSKTTGSRGRLVSCDGPTKRCEGRPGCKRERPSEI